MSWEISHTPNPSNADGDADQAKASTDDLLEGMTNRHALKVCVRAFARNHGMHLKREKISKKPLPTG